MDTNKILKSVTVRVTFKDESRGTGIIYKPKGSDRLYIFTAKHCIGVKKSNKTPKQKHILIDKIGTAKKSEDYRLAATDQIFFAEDDDIAALVIEGRDFPDFEKISEIHLAALDQDGGAITFKGFPFLKAGEKIKSDYGVLRLADAEGDNFEVQTAAGFLQYYEESSMVGLSKGFSGSGICACNAQGVYLQGIVSEFDKAVGFRCVALPDFIRAKLPELRLLHIAVEQYLPDTLFETNLKKTLEQLKPRYQELNFPLPIERAFEQLDLTDEYISEVKDTISRSLTALRLFRTEGLRLSTPFVRRYGTRPLTDGEGNPGSFDATYQLLQNSFAELPDDFIFLENDFEDPDAWENAISSVSMIRALLSSFLEAARTQVDEDAEMRTISSTDLKNLRQFNSRNEKFVSELNRLQQFVAEKWRIGSRYLFIKGKAGNGKSQLLGFTANKRQFSGAPSILILGQSLTRKGSIWSQIAEYVCHQPIDEHRFLELLNLKGQLSGRPVILFIDAINEGHGIRLWNNGLPDFIDAIAPHTYIKVVLTYRTSYERALFRNLEIDHSATIEHHGFRGLERQAVKFFFEKAELMVPVLPYYHLDFGNPLFLRLFTLLYKNRRGRIELHSWVGTLAVYVHFFQYINEQLADRFEYDPDRLDLVELAIRKFVKKQLKKRLAYLKYLTAAKLVEKAVQFLVKERGFFEALVSEGLFYENRYLTAEDEDEPGVDFAYQKLGEYIKVRYLLRHLNQDSLQSAAAPDQSLFFLADGFEHDGEYQGFLEALSMMLPFYFQRELFEIWPQMLERDDVVRAFVSSLRDRSAATVTSKTKIYIMAILKSNVKGGDTFWTEILNNSFQPANVLNTDFIHDYLMGLSLVDRDISWTQYINNNYDEYRFSSVSMIVNWAFDYKKNGIADENAIKAIGKTLFWFFTSTNRQLRDRATKAAIFLFKDNLPLLKPLLEDFELVNDPYITQRIYAVAFGAMVRNHRPEALKTLTDYIYQHVFDQVEVIPDILVRDYARLAIEYAIHLGLKVAKPAKIRPPYKGKKLPKAPGDENIELYPELLGYEADSRYAGIHSILHSMITEHGSRGHMYGDFGRYTFGYAVKHWKGYPDNLLSNLAIKQIVEGMGYNRTLSEIDKEIGYTGRSPLKIERIGKKYQWITFHRILARLADSYTFYDSSSRYAEKSKFSGAWNPNVRDIDPTTDLRVFKEKPENMWWRYDGYGLSGQSMKTWLKDQQDLVDPSGIIAVKDNEGTEWLVLETHRNWREGDRELWYQLRSYLIKTEHRNAILDWMVKQDLMGRWMPEAQSRTELYLREYFWSPAVKDFSDSYYSGEIWRDLRGQLGGKKIGDISVSTVEYLWEKGADKSQEESASILLPNELLFGILGLRHGDQDGHFENESGSLVAFDPAANYDTPSCLLIKKKELLEALAKAGLTIFWTGLSEKLNTGHFDQAHRELFQRMEISQVTQLQDDNLSVTTKTRTAL